MKAANVIVACACAVAVVAATLAVAQFRRVRIAGADLESTKQNRIMLQAQVDLWGSKLREAERRAVAAERDTAELLTAVNAVRNQPAGETASPSRGGNRETARVSRDGIDDDAARAQHGSAAGSGLPPGTRYRTTATMVNGQLVYSTVAESPEDQVRLEQERKYQQELARKRAEEAKEKAAFDMATHALDAPTRFDLLIQRARTQAAVAQFAFAIRTYNEAMTIKPADLPVTEDVRELQRVLQEQNKPVDLTLISDGETFVSIANTRAPQRFTSTVAKLLPGDYEVVGRRRGYRDAIVRIQVRSGQPATVVTVVCTQVAVQ